MPTGSVSTTRMGGWASDGPWLVTRIVERDLVAGRDLPGVGESCRAPGRRGVRTSTVASSLLSLGSSPGVLVVDVGRVGDRGAVRDTAADLDRDDDRRRVRLRRQDVTAAENGRSVRARPPGARGHRHEGCTGWKVVADRHVGGVRRTVVVDDDGELGGAAGVDGVVTRGGLRQADVGAVDDDRRVMGGVVARIDVGVRPVDTGDVDQDRGSGVGCNGRRSRRCLAHRLRHRPPRHACRSGPGRIRCTTRRYRLPS